jgi:hypothetical protein
MMVDGLGRLQALQVMAVVASDAQEHLQDEGLDVDDGVRVAGVLRVVPADVSLGILHLQRQQIRLVEEEDDGDALKRRVVDYRVEDVLRLLEAVRSTASWGIHGICWWGGRRQQLTDPPLAPDQTPTSTRETESMSLNRRSILSIFDVVFVARRRRRRRMECSVGEDD